VEAASTAGSVLRPRFALADRLVDEEGGLVLVLVVLLDVSLVLGFSFFCFLSVRMLFLVDLEVTTTAVMASALVVPILPLLEDDDGLLLLLFFFADTTVVVVVVVVVVVGGGASSLFLFLE
jgi:hypothetical protein